MDTRILDKTLELFASIDPELQIQTIRVFLFVAIKGSCVQKDVETGLGMTNPSASRNVSYWTDLRFDKKAGKGFISRHDDVSDRRHKVLMLTKKGKEFYEKVTKI